MALNKTALKNSIRALIEESFQNQNPESREAAWDNFATKLSDAIDIYTKTATVVIAPGAVVTTGSATTQTNANPVNGALQ